MTGYVGTALRAALTYFEETLQVISVTKTRSRGRTQATEAAARSFLGSIAPAEEWKQVIASGGEISATQPVLVISSALLDDSGQSLAISKDDQVIRADGQRFKVIGHICEGDRYGVVLYTLTESRK